jgi:hypothetical protein
VVAVADHTLAVVAGVDFYQAPQFLLNQMFILLL